MHRWSQVTLGFVLVALIAASASALSQVGQSASSSSPSTRSLRPRDFKALSWRSIGPANMGGRVADVCFAPGNAKTFYVAFGTGGLFKTTNRGITLSPVFDRYETASIGSVVVCDAPENWPGWKDEKLDLAEEAAKKDLAQKDPDAAKKAEAEKGKAKIVWVGTGEGNNRNSSSWGHGVYRSTDGGGEFTNVGLAETHNIPRLAVDPRNPDVCYAAAMGHLWGPNAERGVFKTTDGGKTWSHALKADANTGACDVIVDPASPDVVYAAMYARQRSAYSYTCGKALSDKGGIYKSADMGVTWVKLTNGLPAATQRIGLDIFRKDPRIVYAIVETDEGGFGVEPFDDRTKEGGVYRSEDAGQTWRRLNPFNPRAFYFSKIRVDPQNDQRVYVLGYGLWISDDGGATFRAGGARKPHGDLHAMAIDVADPDQLVLGTDGGVYVSHDKAATWDFLNTVAAGEFYNIGADNFGSPGDFYRIAGGLQDNCTWMGPNGTGRQSGAFEGPDSPKIGITNADWRMITGSDGFHVAFDPFDPNIFYSEGQGGELIRTHLDSGFQKLIRPSPREGQPRFRFNWNSPLIVSAHSPQNSTTLYFGGNHVFKLTQQGDRWESISADLSSRTLPNILSVGSEAETHGTVVSLAESALAAGTLWAGTDDGLVHVTTDDGKAWTEVTPLNAETKGKYIARLEASLADAKTVYVAIDGHRSDDYEPHVLVTTDLGKSWSVINGQGDGALPTGSPVFVVREDRKNANVLYAGTEHALYISIDKGQHWTRLNGGPALDRNFAGSLPTVAIDDIFQHSREMDLLVGTHGRSIYAIDDASPLSQLTPEVVASELHLFDPRPARPRVYLPNEGNWGDGFFGAPNPPMGGLITYWVRDRVDLDVNIIVADEKGATMRKLDGPHESGMNRVVWDLQRDPPDRIPDPSHVGAPQFVPPGEYRVTVSMGKLKVSKKLTVLEGSGRE
jgi:photosystem II stability/assembly factor-like uncharacterized protein